MRFIKKWSYSLARGLSSQLNENHEKRSVYYYGFQVVIGTVFKLAILLAVAFILGIFKETMVIMGFFIAFRTTAGGYHMDTYGKCMAASMVIFLLSGLFVHYAWSYWNAHSLAILTIIIFNVGLFSFYRWAPADTPNKPIKNEKKIKSLKRKSMILLTISTFVIFLLILKHLYVYALAGCVGTLVAVFNVTPAGYSFYDAISGKAK
ncbi:MAG: accessory gene regulator B family protein [Clostridiaceae bacterium]|nr:accessory gene regulator B family protein [Clostridiaceae bacterium]